MRTTAFGLLMILALARGIWALPAAQLSWTAPTLNADESPLTDLAGYQVSYGTASGTYTVSLDVGLATSTQINDLTVGQTYYFVVTAYDTSDNDSVFSDEVSLLIAPDPPGDTEPPTVAITAPPTGTVPAGQPLTITAAAQDNVGVVSVTIEVSRNGAVVHTCGDTLAPYTCAWTVPNPKNRVYTITAIATDAAQNTATSAPVVVTSQ